MKMRAVKGMILKDIMEYHRERSVVFWVFIFPLMLVAVFGLLWGGSSPITLKVGVVGNGSLVVSAMGNTTVDGTHTFQMVEFKNVSAGINAVSHGSIKALLIFPPGFKKNLTSGIPARIHIYYSRGNPSDYQIAKGMVGSFIGEFSHQVSIERVNILAEKLPSREKGLLYGAVEPVTTVIEEIPGAHPQPMKFYVTGFIALQFLFATMSLIGIGTLKEIEKGTLRRIAASPTTPWDFIVGKSLSTLIVIIASILVGIAFAAVAFHTTVFPDPTGWAIIFLMALFSMGLGLTIAMLTRDVKTANAVINAVSFPMLFLAAIFVPLSTLPNWAKVIVDYFPLGRGVQDLRLLTIYSVPPSKVAPDLVWLALSAAASVGMAVLSYQWAIKKLS